MLEDGRQAAGEGAEFIEEVATERFGRSVYNTNSRQKLAWRENQQRRVRNTARGRAGPTDRGRLGLVAEGRAGRGEMGPQMSAKKTNYRK